MDLAGPPMSVMITSPNPVMRFTTDGTSMGNFILAGDELIAKRLLKTQYRLGDVLVYMHPELEKPIAHRLRWIRKSSKNEWLFCLSGDSHPLMYEWIHEDYIRGKVELILKENGQKFPGPNIKQNHAKSHWVSFVPRWIRHQTKNNFIKILQGFQSLKIYRRIMRRIFGSRAYLLRYEQPNHLALEARIFDHYAGRGYLVFDGNEGPEIANLEIRSRYQGMGIGKKLLQFLIQEARRRKAASLQLSVWIRDKAALHLYQSMGFRTVREENLSSVRWIHPRRMLKMELPLNHDSTC